MSKQLIKAIKDNASSDEWAVLKCALGVYAARNLRSDDSMLKQFAIGADKLSSEMSAEQASWQWEEKPWNKVER